MSPSIDTISWSATNEAVELESSDEARNPSPDSKSNTKSTLMISIRNGTKSYGRHVVLNRLNMTVEKGTIYALLGASGCGKTTLLSCIVGAKTLNHGQIFICGQPLEFIKAQGGLRSKVGYMPQELALYKEFTIREALLYFGRIFGMSEKFISLQSNFLITFLQLPDPNTEIRQLSGGQQRRTSFAVALLHSPELLILDEPTVGVDPLLRKSIWEHLGKLVQAGHTTVIITTHYIEEASGADAIGMMRNGRILAQGPPNLLLASHQCTNLEQLFLTLSVLDENGNEPVSNSNYDDSPIYSEATATADARNNDPESLKLSILSQIMNFRENPYLNRLRALILKNLIYIWRQFTYIFILLFFPAIELLLCCWAVGDSPWGLGFGVVNFELSSSNSTSCDDLDNRTCESLHLSCDFVEKLSQLSTFNLMNFASEDEAMDSVKSGEIWGFMTIPANFTRLSLEKALAGLYADNETVHGSKILIKLDTSNLYTFSTIQKALYETFLELMRKMIQDCEPEYISEIVDGPLWFDAPIFGPKNPTLTEYMCPGILLIVMYFAAISVTGMSYVLEKKQGMLERSIVAGVSTTEIITAQFLTQYLIIAVQTGICLAVVFGIFKIPVNEQFGLIVLLILLQGSLGMLAGFFLSSICNEETVVMQLSTALTIPCTILGGTVWPISGMPTILRYVAYIFVPQTFASEAIRSMMTRGWGLTHPNVWPGFLVTIAWLIFLWTIAIIFAKRSVSPTK